MLLLRRIKHELFMNTELRKYLAYAFGEMLLVVLGILIALQINNWNEDRKERATLQAYLENIARNMREDQAQLKPLRERRAEALYLSSRSHDVQNRDQLNVNEVFFVGRLWQSASLRSFFSAHTSGFEGLKGSGVLNRLQGSGLERLLSGYYDNVRQVELLEKSFDETMQPLLTELRQVQSRQLPPWAIFNPSAVPPEQFQALQPYYDEFTNSRTMVAIADALYANRDLVLHYDSLSMLANAFIQAVEAGRLDAPADTVRTPVDDDRDKIGPADIVVDGRPMVANYFLAVAPPMWARTASLDSVQLEDGALQVNWPGGNDWGAVFWINWAGNTARGRSTVDMSGYRKLVLELKGDVGGEVLKVHVKDANYPDDVDPISVDVTLTTDWQTHEIELSRFAPNDPSLTHVALGLLVYPAQDPMSFSVRNARYE